MSLTPQQHHKQCEQFLNCIQISGHYTKICQLLLQWQHTKKSSCGAIQAFVKITQAIRERQELVHQLNKCLDKQATVPLNSTRLQIIDAARRHDNYNLVFDSVQKLLKNDISNNQPLPQPVKIGDLSDKQILVKIQSHSSGTVIIKVINLFLKCIISLQEFRRLLLPLHKIDQKLYQHISHLAEEIQVKRRKVTIFAPLNQLVDQSYPLKQIGRSYSKTPDGYANYGKNWKDNPFQFVLNRQCVSVPLGQQASFIIARKNQFQQQLFENQSEKYEIDIAIQNLKMAIKQIQKIKTDGPQKARHLDTVLIENLINRIYPNQNIHKIVLQKPDVAYQVILPRLQQKLIELQVSRKKFQKHCNDIAIKNFEKSLDYRCFYFKKNDKKFNSSARYDEEIKLRTDQILSQLQKKTNQSSFTDRYLMQTPRNFTINTFDNITKEKFIQQQEIKFDFDRKLNSQYPKFPQNQILFILNFFNLEVLNDVLQIIMYHCSKKNILQLLMFKMMGFSIQRRLRKDTGILKFLDQKISNKQNNIGDRQNQNSNFNMGFDLLNQKKDRRGMKDVNILLQFEQFIEQQVESTYIQDIQSPFQGPDQHTFIATKSIYHFMRYLLTLYQRFMKAKQISDERCKGSDSEYQPSSYSLFIAVLTLKLKDPKLPDYLRTILKKDAFIFLTLDKIINNQVKIINNINNDTLTYKLIKQGMKDYESQIQKWSDYKLPSTYSQLIRIYNQKDSFFRFSFVKQQGNIYISAWKNQLIEDLGSNFRHHIHLSVGQKKISKPFQKKKNKQFEQIAECCNLNSQFFHTSNSHKMFMKGEQFIIRINDKNVSQLQKIQRELNRLKRRKND